ncbi:MAG: DUF883 domain-containing protein [Candidatus Margulisiibacteriota bacterium]
MRAVVADVEELLKATADQTGDWIAAARGKAERIRPGFITGSSFFGLCLTTRSSCPRAFTYSIYGFHFRKVLKNLFVTSE